MDDGTDESFESPGTDTGRRTGPLRRVREWVIVDADRLAVAAAISVGTFLALLALNELGVVAFVNDDSVTRVASGMIAGTFSIVTLVVSINQLILSREFVDAGESEEKLEDVLSFREAVADAAAVPASPSAPARLLELLVAAVDDRAGSLADAAAGHDQEVESHLLPYADAVRESADRIDETLSGGEFDTVRAVSAAIDYDDAWQLHGARHLRGRYGDRLSPAADEALAELAEVLELFAVAREHLKTTYLQRELTRFSQLTVYTGVPAVLSAVLLGFLYGNVWGAAVRVDLLPVVVSALVAVAVSPLALLASYILRTAAVTRRSASLGPMRPQLDEEGPFAVTYGEESERDSDAAAGDD